MHPILGTWMQGWGIEVSETILVTDRGSETLTRIPRV
jgi:ectoine hydrolase